MKRSKNEHLQASVSQYLKRRQFPESDTSQKRECKYNHPVQFMALKGTASGESSTDNMLAYSSISGDATVCEQQFSRLKSFLQESSSVLGGDILNLMYPVFVHMYVELLNNGHKTPAHKFFNRHSGMFRLDEKRKDMMDILPKLYTKDDILQCKKVQDMRDQRYEVAISKEAFECINKHLKAEDNMIMMQIFNQYIKLKVAGHYNEATVPFESVKTETSTTLGLKDDKPVDGHHQPVSPAIIPDNKVVQDDQALSSLRQCIKEVREGPPPLPSICFYSVMNAHQGLCCASTSPDRELFSAGFEDSCAKVWKLVPGSFPSVDVVDSPSYIYLSADYLETDEDEEDDLNKSASQDQECITLKGHTGCVYQARFTRDSGYLLTCSDDCSVRLWDIDQQKNVVIYNGHSYPVWDVDASMVGDYFASCSHDQTAKLWCTERTYPLRSFVGHTHDVDCVRFHPNSNYVATGSGDKTVRLWSVQEGKSVRLLSGHKSSVLALAFSPNGTMLASSGEDRRVRVWDLRNGGLMKEFRGHTDTVYSLSFNQDNSVLASAGLDSCIRIWDLRKTPSGTGSDGHTSPELLGAFQTKSVPVVYLNYVKHNVLLGSGAPCEGKT